MAETVKNLKPTPSTTTVSPKKVVQVPQEALSSGGNITEEQQVAQIEAFLAFALAQEIGASIGANTSAFPRPSSNSDAYSNPPSTSTTVPLHVVQDQPPLQTVQTVSDITLSPEPSSLQELFSSTFKTFDVRGVNSDRVSSEGGLAIYAPNYAPNYIATTTTPKIPVYAPAFDHHSFTVSPSTSSPLKLIVTEKDDTNSTTEGSVETETDETETPLPTTTDEDDDDYEDNDN